MAVRIASRSQSRGRRERSPLLAIAIIIAAVTIALSFHLKSSNATSSSARASDAPIVVGEFDVVSIPVPVEPVAAGQKLKDIRLRLVSFPRHQVPAGAVVDTVGLEQAVAVSALPANLPLFRENFTSVGGGINPVVESIPPGMRAMTVHVDATSSVEGWAGSGSVVDVLLVERDRTTVIAERVKILSAERSVSPVDGAAAPSVPSTATLLVTQDQCLAINTAIPRGKIAFALRSGRDDQQWNDTVFTAEQLKARMPTESKVSVTGFVSVKDKSGQPVKSFALADGKWTKAANAPEGFGRVDAAITGADRVAEDATRANLGSPK